MNQPKTIDGLLLAKMFRKGAKNLRDHVSTINDLNVFPIPDGDTGDNMLMTSIGGVDKIDGESQSVSSVSHSISDGMLMSARGNSGVILSQIFEGIAGELENVDTAESDVLQKALQNGTKHAYSAVMEPTEGTMLTVMRCATEYISKRDYSSPEELLKDFLEEAKRTLEKTPDMLPVLKKAGVVDSGGAGLVYIIEGMLQAFTEDDDDTEDLSMHQSAGQDIDISLFTEDSVLEFGYCTEVLLRLQRSKCDIEHFSIETIRDFLNTIGDSVVTFMSGTIVKIHVHTKTPDKVLAFCQQYGEFLKIKIENMSLQHNNVITKEEQSVPQSTEKKKNAVIAVASGEGIKEFFKERGADVIVDGGQSMNPSTESFLEAFRKAGAENIFVLPNNSNIILGAKLAQGMYKDANVYVVESHNIGEGYAALSMYTGEGEADDIYNELTDAMSGVVTAEVSKSIRDADGVKKGEYIGFTGKNILTSADMREDAVMKTLSSLDFASHDIVLLIYGKSVDSSEAERIEKSILEKYRGKEVYLVDGKQEVYDYIMILE